jgi:hypothetical protein
MEDIVIQHPAKFSAGIIEVAAPFLRGYAPVLDMFAGTGGVYKILDYGYDGSESDIIAVELEPEWVACHPLTVQGDALALDLEDNCVEAVFCSPAYANRMADQFTPGEGWESARKTRNTYAHKLGRKLSNGSGASLQWGADYCSFHRLAWIEAKRVFNKDRGGPFILNTSNHIRGGVEQRVTEWHVGQMLELGFTIDAEYRVLTQRNRYGANSGARVGYESVHIFKYTGE